MHGDVVSAGFSCSVYFELFSRRPLHCVIAAATKVDAQVIGRARDLGTIEVGKLANFVIVTGNDLFAATNPIKHVFIEGRIY